VAKNESCAQPPEVWTDAPVLKTIAAGVAYEAAEGADALAIVTEWQEFRSPDFERLKQLLKAPVIFDGRNLYDPGMARRFGFTYYAIGRGISLASA